MLPTTCVGRPVARNSSPTSVVVVVLPLVPVMAHRPPRIMRAPSSNSPMTSTPASIASCTNGLATGMPGLRIIMSWPARCFCGPSPSAKVHPSAFSSSSAPPKLSSVFMSLIVTIAPRFASSLAAATPLRAMPSTSTRLFLTSILMPPIRATRLFLQMCKASPLGRTENQFCQLHRKRLNARAPYSTPISAIRHSASVVVMYMATIWNSLMPQSSK